MKKIIILFVAIILSSSINIMAQNNKGCHVYSDPGDILSMPYFGNNRMLEQFGEIFKKDSLVRAKTSTYTHEDGVSYSIPCRIFIFHDDNGSNAAITQQEAYDIIEDMNFNFVTVLNSNINFYLKCEVTHINNTQYNTVDNNTERDELFDIFSDDNVLSIHYVRNIANAGGWGRFPITGTGQNFRCMIVGGDHEWNLGVTMHEVGHCMGLRHTHDNVRGAGSYNGSANECEQESQRRDRKIVDLTCGLGVYNDTRCEVNGDALCDTDASPVANFQDGIPVNNSVDCEYTGNGVDHWNDTWTPPGNNVMSYLSDAGCHQVYTTGQIEIMRLTALLWFVDVRLNFNKFKLVDVAESGDNYQLYAPETIDVAIGTDNYTVEDNATVYLHARDAIDLHPGFTASVGANFTAVVAPINDCSLPPTGLDDLPSSSMQVLNPLNEDKVKQGKQLVQDALLTVRNKYAKELNPAEWDVSLYPNPSSDVVNLQYNFGNYSGEVDVKVMSLTGAVLQNYQFNAIGIMHSTYTMNLKDLPAGVYLVRINANGNIKSLKLVKD